MLLKFLLLASSGFCLVYGLTKYLGKHVATFCTFVVSASGCYMLGHFYELLSDLIVGFDPTLFNVGMLARIGGLAFIYSASFAQMDGLVDDGTNGVKKYRLLALIAPAILIVLYVVVLLSQLTVFVKFIYGIIFAFACLASYYNLKHLIIPDISYGIISSIRTYSLFSILSTFFYGLMVVSSITGHTVLQAIFTILLAISYPCVVIAMEKGRKKWIN